MKQQPQQQQIRKTLQLDPETHGRLKNEAAKARLSLNKLVKLYLDTVTIEYQPEIPAKTTAKLKNGG